MEKIYTKNAPDAIGPYSQAIKVGNLVFTSGQIALDPKTGLFAGEDITTQAEQVMKNLSAVLLGAVALNGTVHFLIDVGQGVRRGEDDLDHGVGRVEGHFLLDGQRDFHVFTGPDLLSADEAVERGLLGDGADVGRQHDVQEAEALVALGDHLLAEGVGFGDVQLVGKVVHGVGAVLHDEGHHLGHGLGGADAAAVLAIPPSLLAGSGTGQAGLGGGGGCFGIGHRGLQGESLLAHGGLLPICIF